MKNITKSKTIYSLARPVWLNTAVMSEDINRDRQALGIILAAGQSVKYTRPMQYSVQS
ncbi:hypothetical protein [Serratia liquefaciens]|uniref:hypothetical protein n=1 Tax=Serratia liquefaciens TaxID=614 RepID=UPI00301E4270